MSLRCIGPLGLLICALTTATAFPSPRVALILEPDSGMTMDRALPHARMLLALDGAVQTVDREHESRALQEQANALRSGNAMTPLQVGTLMSADVLGVVTVSPADGRESILVFDVATGVRYIDQPLPPSQDPIWPRRDPAADGIVKAVHSALAKRALPVNLRHTVCLVSVRNADLPPDAGPFCDQVGQELMRSLTQQPVVAVLERDRLDLIIAERKLPTSQPEPQRLLSAATEMTLQLSRSGDGDVTAKALLTRPDGQAIVSPSSTTHGRNVRPLVDELTNGVVSALATGGRTDGPSAEVQAQSFREQAALAWSRGDNEAALKAAESAFALSPHAPGVRATLARANIRIGVGRLFEVAGDTQGDYSLSPLFTPAADAFAPAFEQMFAGAQLLPDTASDEAGLVDREYSVGVLRQALAELAKEAFSPPHPTLNTALVIPVAQREAFDRLRHSVRRLRIDVEQPLEVEAVRSVDDFKQYTAFLRQLLIDSRLSFSTSPGEWVDDVHRLVPQWMKLAEQYDPPVVADSHPWALHQLDAAHISRQSFLAALGDTMPRGTGSCGGAYFDFADQPDARKPFTASELDVLDGVFSAIGAHKDEAFSECADAGHSFVGKARFDLVKMSNPPVPRLQPQRLVAADPPTPVAADTAADEPQARGLFWKQSLVLADVAQASSGVQRLFDPVVVDDSVYVVGILSNEQGTEAQLLKFDVNTGHRTVLGKDADPQYSQFTPDRVSAQTKLDMAWPNTFGQIDGNTYVFASRSGRLLMFPLAGGAPTVLQAKTLGFPTAEFSAAAKVGDFLYVVLNQGDTAAFGASSAAYLLKVNLKDNSIQTLASSQRKERLSPFDDCTPMTVNRILDDPARHQILFAASGAGWPQDRAGLWSLDTKTDLFKQLINADSNARTLSVKRSPFSADQVRLGVDGFGHIYDLVTGKTSLDPVIILKPAPGYSESLDAWSGQPAALLGDWLVRPIVLGKGGQKHGAWGRLNLKTHERQLFPYIRLNMSVGSWWPPDIQKVDNDRFLVSDPCGLWVLTPPDQTEIAIAYEGPDDASSHFMGDHEWEKILGLKVKPAQPAPAGGQLPWTAATTLYDVAHPTKDDNSLDAIDSPRPHGGFIYAVGLGHHGNNGSAAFVRLLRFDPKTDIRTSLGDAGCFRPNWATAAPPAARPNSVGGGVTGIEFTAASCYVVVANDLYEFPLAGGDGHAYRPVSPNNRSANVSGNVCSVDQKLFVVAGLPSVQICQVDPASHAFIPVLRGPGKDDPSRPHRDGGRVALLAGDESKHRLIYLAYGAEPNATTDGVNALDVTSGKSTLLVPLYLHPMLGGDQWAGMSTRFQWSRFDPVQHQLMISTSRGLLRMDLATDSIERLYQASPGVDPLSASAGASVDSPPGNPAPLNGQVLGLQPPFAIVDRWLWTAMSFGRVSLDGTRWELFPPLRPEEHSIVPRTILPIDDEQLLVADGAGCWVLKLRP